MRKLHFITIGLFILWLSSGFVGTSIQFDAKNFSQKELRPPADFPVRPASMEDVRRYLLGLESWFTDRAFARQQYLTLYHTLGLQERYGLTLTPTVLGRDNWIFLGNQHRYVLNYTGNEHGVNAGELGQRLAEIRAMAEACRERNIPFALLVAPNKHTIYSEYLPGWLHIKSDYRLPDAVLEQARAEGLPFVYPKQELLAKKEEMARQGKPIYYRQDTHWNWFGALTAYDALRRELLNQKYALAPLPYDTVRTVPQDRYGDLIGMGRYKDSYKGLEEYVYDIDPKLQSSHEKTGKLLLVGDSFLEKLRPLLDLSFHEVKQQHVLLDKESLYKTLETYKPDVVIYEVVERDFAEVKDLFSASLSK